MAGQNVKKVKPLSEDAAWDLFTKLDLLGFVSGIHKSIWGSKDGKRWEVACTPSQSMMKLLVGTGLPAPDRWDDGTAIWGARR